MPNYGSNYSGGVRDPWGYGLAPGVGHGFQFRAPGSGFGFGLAPGVGSYAPPGDVESTIDPYLDLQGDVGGYPPYEPDPPPKSNLPLIIVGGVLVAGVVGLIIATR